MRINEYTSFEQFYEGYSYDRDIANEHYIGLEFKYRGKYYGLGHDYSSDDLDNTYKYWSYELGPNKNAPIKDA